MKWSSTYSIKQILRPEEKCAAMIHYHPFLTPNWTQGQQTVSENIRVETYKPVISILYNNQVVWYMWTLLHIRIIIKLKLILLLVPASWQEKSKDCLGSQNKKDEQISIATTLTDISGIWCMCGVWENACMCTWVYRSVLSIVS